MSSAVNNNKAPAEEPVEAPVEEKEEPKTYEVVDSDENADDKGPKQRAQTYEILPDDLD